MATKAIARRRTVVRYVARRAGRKARGLTVPVAVLAGLSVPALFLWNNSLKSGDIKQTANSAAAIFTGFNPQGGWWDWKYLNSGLFPVVGGILVHKLASKLGVNRALAQAGVPFIRI